MISFSQQNTHCCSWMLLWSCLYKHLLLLLDTQLLYFQTMLRYSRYQIQLVYHPDMLWSVNLLHKNLIHCKVKLNRSNDKYSLIISFMYTVYINIFFICKILSIHLECLTKEHAVHWKSGYPTYTPLSFTDIEKDIKTIISSICPLISHGHKTGQWRSPIVEVEYFNCNKYL